MKAAISFLILFIGLSANGIAQEVRDTFKYTANNGYPAPFGSNNWEDDINSFSLRSKCIPVGGSYHFPAILFFSDTLFSGKLSGSDFTLRSDVEISNCTFYDSNYSRDFFFGKESPHLFEDPYMRYRQKVWRFISPTFDKQKNYIDIRGNITVRDCLSEGTLEFSFLKTDSGKILFTHNDFSDLDLKSIKAYRLSSNFNNIRQLSLQGCQVNEFTILGDSVGRINKEYVEESRKYWNGLFEYYSGKGGETLKELWLEMIRSLPSTDSIPDSYDLRNDSSEFGSVNLLDIKSKLITINFTKCRINGYYDFEDPKLKEIDDEDIVGKLRAKEFLDTMTQRDALLDASFNYSFINGRMINPRQKRHLVYTFDKCVFGPNADLSELYFDRIIITNCGQIATNLYLTFPASSKVEISIVNSDLDKIHFDYASNVDFIPDPYGNETNDQINNAYVALLAKFRKEGKAESFQRLDIEHRQWEYAHRGIWGKMLNTLDRYWWYYGYRKHYIIYWSLVLLLLFTVLNFWLWNRLKSIYPVIENESTISYFDRMNKKNQEVVKSIHVLITTFFIFFSFSLEFNKMNYRNTRMVLFFFLQYIAGLVCLFFIVNFILKS